MIYSYKKLFFLALFSFFSIVFGQECDPGFIWLEDVPVGCGGEHNCFYEADLAVLQEMIDNSASTINMLLDDNEDGIMEPVELGYTEWVNGRLVTLDCFLSEGLFFTSKTQHIKRIQTIVRISSINKSNDYSE